MDQTCVWKLSAWRLSPQYCCSMLASLFQLLDPTMHGSITWTKSTIMWDRIANNFSESGLGVKSIFGFHFFYYITSPRLPPSCSRMFLTRIREEDCVCCSMHLLRLASYLLHNMFVVVVTCIYWGLPPTFCTICASHYKWRRSVVVHNYILSTVPSGLSGSSKLIVTHQVGTLN